MGFIKGVHCAVNKEKAFLSESKQVPFKQILLLKSADIYAEQHINMF